MAEDNTTSLNSIPFTISADTIYPPTYHYPETSVRLGGTITSKDGNITELNIGIFDTSGTRIFGTTVNPNALTFDILSVDDSIKFRSLTTIGNYFYRIIATNNAGTYTVIDYPFIVAEEYYDVIYNADGYENVPETQKKPKDLDLTLSSNTPAKTGNIFIGWADDSTKTTPDYLSGGTYTDNSAITLYAVWKNAANTRILIDNTRSRGLVWVKVGDIWHWGIVWIKDMVWKQGI